MCKQVDHFTTVFFIFQKERKTISNAQSPPKKAEVNFLSKVTAHSLPENVQYNEITYLPSWITCGRIFNTRAPFPPHFPTPIYTWSEDLLYLMAT